MPGGLQVLHDLRPDQPGASEYRDFHGVPYREGQRGYFRLTAYTRYADHAPVNSELPSEAVLRTRNVDSKQTQALSRAGLVRSIQGQAGGYVLTRDPTSMTVLDAVGNGRRPRPGVRLHGDPPAGPLGTPPEECTEPCPVARAMAGADNAWRVALRSVSIADLVRDVTTSSGRLALPPIGTWLSTPET
ncbi:Rrf2 family transcriptional regulator [Streptomyces sp. NPDC048304]|uniref:Rrf2 family transcriptional regulator n=1 Tax=Streptomyces sp. NPDC048304 TaxID=3154820 RepID=UPI0033C2200F